MSGQAEGMPAAAATGMRLAGFMISTAAECVWACLIYVEEMRN
jgi:hypothetical protein